MLTRIFVCAIRLAGIGTLSLFTLLLNTHHSYSQGSDAFSTSAPDILFNPTSGNLLSASKEIASCGFGAYLTSSGIAGFSNNYLFSCSGSTCAGTNSNDNETDFIDLWYKVVLPTGTTQMNVLVNGLQVGEYISFSIYTANPGTSNSSNLIPFSASTTVNATPSAQGGIFSITKTFNTVTGLTAGGTYYLRVMAVQPNANLGCTDLIHPSFTIEAQAPQANDACSNAINITTNNGGIAHTGNYSAAVSEGTDEWTDCSLLTKTAAKDLWYRINYPTATAGTIFLSELTISGTPGETVRVIVYNVTHGCGTNPASTAVEYCEEVTLTSVGYSTSFNDLQSTQGQTRRVQIIPVGTVGNVTVSGKVVAANNSCSWFQNVFPGFTLTTPQAVNFNYGSPSSSLPTETGTDLWYAFDPILGTDNGLNVYSTSATITVSGLAVGQSIRVMIYKGNSLSVNNCSDLSNNYISSLDFTTNGSATYNCLDEIHGITAGGYLVRIIQTGGTVASPTVTVTPSAAGKYNNSCVNIWDGNGPQILGASDAAHSYNPFYILSGETVTGNFTGSTDCDQEITSSSCSGVSNDPAVASNQRDLWYIFRVPNSSCPSLSSSTVVSEMTLNYNAGNSVRDARIYVYSSCGDAQLVACSPTLDGAGTNWTVNGLTQGEYYLIRIKPSSLNSNFDYPFNLSVTNGVVRPCNNEGSDANLLTINACNDYDGLAIYSMKGADPSPSTGVPENDVWFTFTAPSPANGGSYFNANKSWVTVFLENVSGTSTGPLSIQLYSDPFNIIATANTFSTGNAAGSQAFAHFGHLEPGQQYYLRIYHKESATAEVNYKVNAYTPNANETAWTCGMNNSSLLSGCSEGCNDLREAWFKIDLPVGTPSNHYFMIEVVGNDQILDFELRSQHLTEASANEGDYDDYDHPCASRPLEPGITTVSEVYGITVPMSGGSCNTNGDQTDGGSGVRRVYFGMNGPAAGMKDYYYIKVFMDPSDPNYATTTGLKICALNFNGPFSTAILASAGGANDVVCSVTPLGVELTTLLGTRNEGVSELFWETASELNNSHFEVQYSTNGIDFLNVGTLTGHGTSTEAHSYQFEHRTAGIDHYYRLKQIDYDGTENLSDIISLHDKLSGIQVFPNPVDGNASLSIRSKNAITSVVVLNMVGQVVQSETQLNEHYLQLLPIRESGVFIIKVQCAEKESVFRIISH